MADMAPYDQLNGCKLEARMFSRRLFLGASSAAALLAVARSASAEENTQTVLDLNFFDRSAAADHARAFDAALRYVNHEVFDDPAGIVIEDAALNGVEDAGYAGSGSYPDGWQLLPQPAAPAGFSAIFTRTGASNGRLRLQGGSAGDFTLIMGSSRHFSIAKGDLLTGSVAIRLADGDRSSLASLGLLVRQNDLDGTPVNHAPPVTPIQQIQTDKPWWAQVQIVAAEGGFANLALKITTSGRFDLTFEINFPQLEKRPWRSTFCAASREADHVLLSAPTDYLSQTARSVVITADAPRFVPMASLWSEYANADNYIEVQLRDRVLVATVVANHVRNEIRLGVVPPLMRFTVCLSVRATGLAASLNGKPPQSIDCPVPKGLTVARLGGGINGAWNSTIGRLTLFKGVVPDIALQSRRGQVFFDDFDRPDSASLGRSPTGQTIEKTGGNDSAIVGRKWVVIPGGLGLAFAAYGKIALPKVPRYLGAVLTWTTGNSGGCAGLLAATNVPPDPVDALHTVVCDDREIFQTISNTRVEKALAEFIYPIAMRRDGETQYGVARMLNSTDSAVVYVGPQGDLVRHLDPTYAARIGSIAVFEHYWQILQCRPEFLAVAAS
jgi:hypothetical protein